MYACAVYNCFVNSFSRLVRFPPIRVFAFLFWFFWCFVIGYGFCEMPVAYVPGICIAQTAIFERKKNGEKVKPQRQHRSRHIPVNRSQSSFAARSAIDAAISRPQLCPYRGSEKHATKKTTTPTEAVVHADKGPTGGITVVYSALSRFLGRLFVRANRRKPHSNLIDLKYSIRDVE